MRILSLSQTQSKIPDQFRGNPLPDGARSTITSIDAKYNLSYGEVGWLLESLEDDYHLITKGSTNWEKTAEQVEKLFAWSRSSGKKLLSMTLQDAIFKTKTYEIDNKFQQTFAQRPWAIKTLSGAEENMKDGFVQLDSAIENGLSSDEFYWVVSKSINRDLTVDHNRKIFANIINWSRATETKLTTINDLGTAQTLSSEWADYKRKTDLSKLLSKTGLRTVLLPGKWKAVWIDSNAVVGPDPQGHGAHVVTDSGGPAETYEWQIEQQITGISTRNSDKLISIRDQNGVSQASLAIGDETDQRVDITDVEGTTEGLSKIKELPAKLRTTGFKLWWAGDPTEVSSIKELEAAVEDVNGFVPSVTIDGRRRISIGGDSDSYKEALDWIYAEARGGSSSAAERGADALAHYAEQRNELYVLESAREEFAEWAMSSWSDAEQDLQANGVIPRRPNEDDDEFYPNGEFNAEAYAAAETAYYAATSDYETNHEPNRFDNYVYMIVGRKRNEPANKPFYDAIDAQREIERKERERVRREQEEKRRADEAEAAKQQAKAEQRARDEAFAKSELANPSAFQNVEFPEEDDIFAFSIGWKKNG